MILEYIIETYDKVGFKSICDYIEVNWSVKFAPMANLKNDFGDKVYDFMSALNMTKELEKKYYKIDPDGMISFLTRDEVIYEIIYEYEEDLEDAILENQIDVLGVIKDISELRKNYLEYKSKQSVTEITDIYSCEYHRYQHNRAMKLDKELKRYD